VGIYRFRPTAELKPEARAIQNQLCRFNSANYQLIFGHDLNITTVLVVVDSPNRGVLGKGRPLEHTQQRLPQARMCIRVRNVSPKCSTWLHVGSWGCARLHSSVGHPKSKRENANLVDRNHISTHRFSGQKMGGEALVPHSLHDIGSRSASPHLVQLSHWLALLWPPFEMILSWHPAF